MTVLPIVLTWLISMLLTALLGFWLIPILRKLKFGQTILEIGPRWHKDKQGTPTMGGILFILGIVVAVFCGSLLLNMNIGKDLYSHTSQNVQLLWAGVLMAVAFGGVGILDDSLKIAHKENEGLTEKQKLVLQFLIAILYMFSLYLIGERSTRIWIPFLGQFQFGVFYYILSVLGIVFIVNVVNFTDGIDGLCSSVTLVVAVGFLTASILMRFSTMQVLSAALGGGCMGFLFWNLYPAKVFMGDTGSLFLGGLVVALAFGLRMPVILLFFGTVYIIEGLTVIIQTTYFKYTRRKTGTGKRLFKMTPIHHHFEMSGWSENKIVITFSLFQAVFCLLGIWAVWKM